MGKSFKDGYKGKDWRNPDRFKSKKHKEYDNYSEPKPVDDFWKQHMEPSKVKETEENNQ